MGQYYFEILNLGASMEKIFLISTCQAFTYCKIMQGE